MRDEGLDAWHASEGGSQGCAERLGVGEDFALSNVAIFRLEDVFDRVLQRDDVLVPLHVHLFDHGRERSRFTSADRPCRQDQPVLIASEQL